ncbi:hypothetical protein J4216_00060 [Candidatus Woesearchaeota archaeon]|nr:hypothetical protein [Candidatus Woesearchaeota archaeon]
MINVKDLYVTLNGIYAAAQANDHERVLNLRDHYSNICFKVYPFLNAELVSNYDGCFTSCVLSIARTPIFVPMRERLLETAKEAFDNIPEPR